MRARDDARCDVVLNSLRPKRDAHWRTNEFDARAMTDQAFEQHVAALCATAEVVRSERDGTRTAALIERRIEAREREWTRRTALDLQRLADIEARMNLRQAEAARHRWFVLGRLLSRAASNDLRWADAMALLIDSSTLTAHEARALGLTKHKT